MNESIEKNSENSEKGYLFPVTKIICFIYTFVLSFLTITTFSVLLYLDAELDFRWSSEWGTRETTVFCEKTEEISLLSETFNAVSNFGFMYFGIISLTFQCVDFYSKDEKLVPNEITKGWFYGTLIGLGQVFLGFGSFLFHAHPSETTYEYDQAIYSPKFGLYGGDDATRIAYIVAPILFFALLNFATRKDKILQYFNIKEEYIKYIQVETSLDFRIFMLIVCCFVLALVFQEQFIAVPCDSKSKFQFHAAWHGFCALGFFFTYLAVRFEKPKNKMYTLFKP
eukprot:snap_masked-scaffold_1-processed-gene-13.3-mRNA-1 protein AED:1.00 eAED:1.00 QI:0/0/0/0/1/1/2/0/281